MPRPIGSELTPDVYPATVEVSGGEIRIRPRAATTGGRPVLTSDEAAKKLLHAQGMVKKQEAAIARRKTLLAKWKKRVRYYEKLFAQRRGDMPPARRKK